MTLADVMQVYAGSNGEATLALYARLSAAGTEGAIAVELFRAHKASARAKTYRGGVPGRGSYRGMAYGRKDWALDNLCDLLAVHADHIGIAWGWKEDSAQPYHRWVLYAELPTGQVSFHTAARGSGPAFAGVWDGIRDMGAMRICRWTVQLLAAAEAAP